MQFHSSANYTANEENDREYAFGNEFNFAVSTDLTETEPIPNLARVGGFTELGKWKIPNGFQLPNTEPNPKRIGWQLFRPEGGVKTCRTENLKFWVAAFGQERTLARPLYLIVMCRLHLWRCLPFGNINHWDAFLFRETRSASLKLHA